MRDSNVLPLTPKQTFSTCLNQFKKLIICGRVTGFSNIRLISVYIPEESHNNIDSNENLISHVQIRTPGYCFREMSLTYYTLTFYIYHLCQCSVFRTIHYILYRALLFTIYASVPCSARFTTSFIVHFYLPSIPVFRVPHDSLHPLSCTFIYHLCQCSVFRTIHYILYRALLYTIYASVPCSSRFTTFFSLTCLPEIEP